jgi:hypothetical protein
MVPFVFGVVLVGCGTSGGQMDDVPVAPQVVEGVGLQVQEGSRIRTTEQGIAVDAKDGRRWFDLIWTEGIPRAAVEVWAAKSCEAVFWDDPLSAEDPEAGQAWLAMGGMCNISERRHWVIALVRPLGEKTEFGAERLQLTAYIADYAFVPYEDAWVHFASTALTAGAGKPQTTLDFQEIRKRVRVGVAKPTGTTPIPGGGKISTNVHEEMKALYGTLAPPPRPDHMKKPETPASEGSEAGEEPKRPAPAGESEGQRVQ